MHNPFQGTKPKVKPKPYLVDSSSPATMAIQEILMYATRPIFFEGNGIDLALRVIASPK